MGRAEVEEDTVAIEYRVCDRKEAAGGRVDAFLAARLRGWSRAAVQRFIRAGRVFVRGRRAKAATRVGAEDRVVVRFPRREDPPAQAAELAVLYEDERLLAVDKPAGMLSHPTDKVYNNAATTVLGRQFPGLRPRLVHRLDRETSGVLLFAKDPEAARLAAESFAGRRVRKEYLALVAGRVAFARRLVRAAIGREGGAIKVRQGTGMALARPACTAIERVAAGAGASLVRARPRTGRLHQIRVHLAGLGHPVLGDKLYAGTGEAYLRAVRRELTEADLARLGARRQMLHAWRLELPHPESGRRLAIRAPVPADMAAACVKSGLHPRHFPDIDFRAPLL